MGVEEHLWTDELADFAVDMSNVIRERDLGGTRAAELSRFTKLVDGLAVFSNDESVMVYGVADESLLRNTHLLADRERAVLHRWYRQGLIEVLEKADDRLLEIADGTDMKIVSRDSFADYHRVYPWLSGNRDRFLRHVAGRGGTVTVVPRIMPTPSESQMSKKEEESLLLQWGMYDRRDARGPRRDLLSRRWRCPEDDCPLFGPARAGGRALPDNRSGTVSCPTHRRPLDDLGHQLRRVQVKIRVGDAVYRRFVIDAGHQVRVGRAPEPPGIALPTKGNESISRRHVILRWDGRSLTVTDTSSNGTMIRPPTGPPFRLPPGGTRRLRTHESVILNDRVELVVSGREYVIDEPDDPHVPTNVLRRQASEQTRVFDGRD
ncbi:FHA domain-containing protein [Rhizohabitans arisaemae]|uniref:FHA domain-containing protein n=1 Tax=Rhizohabitans arisaemae TaxID=2720610 RepID=UPI0024B23107|nr:FHA domain-containing protein [Rhizohabitans arisaemae]